MDTSKLAHPKPRPAALERKDRRASRNAEDVAENREVKARSGGQCEMNDGRGRCRRRAVHIHHRIGGWGKRARGNSILAENKLHLCEQCHSEIHAHVLVPDGTFFRRVK